MIWFTLIVIVLFAIGAFLKGRALPSVAPVYLPEIPDNLLMEYQLEEKARRNLPKEHSITDPPPSEISIPLLAERQLAYVHKQLAEAQEIQKQLAEVTKVSYKDFKDYPINSILSGEELKYWQKQQPKVSRWEECECATCNDGGPITHPKIMVQTISEADASPYYPVPRSHRIAALREEREMGATQKPHPMGIEVEWKPRQKAGITQRR
jgi:hypothetical protein